MASAVSRVLEQIEHAIAPRFTLAEDSRGQMIAKTIMQQLKALDKWAMASWGATEFVALEDGLQFRVKGSKIKTGGRVQIRLNASDTYDIKLLRIRGVEVKEIGSASGIYVDQLVEVLDDLIG